MIAYRKQFKMYVYCLTLMRPGWGPMYKTYGNIIFRKTAMILEGGGAIMALPGTKKIPNTLASLGLNILKSLVIADS